MATGKLINQLLPSHHLCEFNAYIKGVFCMGFVFYDVKNKKYYLIQDKKDGSHPNDLSWKRYGSLSWGLSEGTPEDLNSRSIDVKSLTIYEKLPVKQTTPKETIKPKDPDSVKVELKLPIRSPIKLSIESEISIKLK